jgi:hypothetical protein
MGDDDKAPFSVVIGAMCETFGQQATKPILHGYWLGLQDLRLEDVQRAVSVAIRSATSLPKPVELRRFAGEQTGEQKALAAWGDVLRAVAIGPYKHVDFQDKLVNAAVRNLGGWPTFCGRFTDEESEKWARLEFIKAYQAFAAGGVDGEVCLPLPGISQAEPIDGEPRTPIPRLIACSPDRAKEPKRIASVQQKSLLEFKTI